MLFCKAFDLNFITLISHLLSSINNVTIKTNKNKHCSTSVEFKTIMFHLDDFVCKENINQITSLKTFKTHYIELSLKVLKKKARFLENVLFI